MPLKARGIYPRHDSVQQLFHILVRLIAKNNARSGRERPHQWTAVRHWSQMHDLVGIDRYR
jgi:hypothetical protein